MLEAPILSQPSALLGQLQSEFIETLPRKIALLEHLCTSLPGKPIHTPELSELLRQVHSLKGSGGIYGLHIITVICHQLEDCITHEVTNASVFSASFAGNCLRHFDLLNKVAELALASPQAEFGEIWSELNRLRDSLHPERGSALVIEQSRLTQNIIAGVLEEFQIRPTLVTDGYRALLHALSEPFSLIITSAETPLLGGFAFSGALRLSDSVNRNVPIVLLTANQSPRFTPTRKTDPSHMITKDTHLIENLSTTLEQVLLSNQH